MNADLMLDVGQANEIKLAARRAGATNADLKQLSEGDMFALILPVLRGLSEVTPITPITLIIDLDADPFVPNGWTAVDHIKGGQFQWSPDALELYLSDGQKNGGVIGGSQLRQELRDKSVVNANLLDWLLAHPYFIPEAWKGQVVVFWGTIYRRSCGDWHVRYLYWNGSQRHWNYGWVDDHFHGSSPALLRRQ